MIEEQSGKIFKFNLDFNLGVAYAELLDFSDVQDFDGILVQVFSYFEQEEEEEDTEKIKSTKIYLGPLAINKYPNTKGKGAWKLIGKTTNYSKESPWFKNLRGVLKKNDWSEESNQWTKSNDFSDTPEYLECTYEEIRNLETLILNHPTSVIKKVTMLRLIHLGKDVNDFYDLSKIGNRNLFVQVINTYCTKKEVKEILNKTTNLFVHM